MLFEEETKPELEGYEKGQVSELGAVNVNDRYLIIRTVHLNGTKFNLFMDEKFQGHRMVDI